MSRLRPLLCASLSLLALSCDRSGSGAQPRSSGSSSASSPEKAQETPPQLARSSEPRVTALVAALERGDLPEARRAAARLGGSDDLDARLALARLLFAEGDQVGAVRTIEEARKAHPRQGRVYATAAELEAMGGRSQDAEGEVREGLARCGPSPDLLRARGVLALCRTGGARLALEHLLSAREQDPALPFVLRPLAQAHVLLGSQSMASDPPDALSALGHARAALKAQDGEPDALRLLADAHSALGELEEAVGIYEQLLAEGDASAAHACAQLLPRAATGALLRRDRDLAARHYARARALGLPDEDLGFGANLLADEVARALDAGLELYEQGDLPRARELFEKALGLDPRSLEGRTFLGAVHFQQGEYDSAAAAWRAVLDGARAQRIELPQPVHLDLARALRMAGRISEARALLRAELEREAEGQWSEQTRHMLARLPESD